MSGSEYAACALMAVGLWLCYQSRKRAFDRTNPCGRQQFRSFPRKGIALLIDAGLLFFGGATAMTGLIFLAFEHHESWGAFVLLPLFWLFFIGYIPGGRR